MDAGEVQRGGAGFLVERDGGSATVVVGELHFDLGTPLVPYEERVARSLRTILHGKRYSWTAPQRKWLERIGKQLHKEVVVDRAAFDAGRFKDLGGFDGVNRTFDGQLAALLGDLQEEIWRDTA